MNIKSKRVKYFPCQLKGLHYGQLLSYVCVDQKCNKKGLICPICIQQCHKQHTTMHLKIFISQLQKSTNNQLDKQKNQIKNLNFYLNQLQRSKKQMLDSLHQSVKQIAKVVKQTEQKIKKQYLKKNKNQTTTAIDDIDKVIKAYNKNSTICTNRLLSILTQLPKKFQQLPLSIKQFINDQYNEQVNNCNQILFDQQYKSQILINFRNIIILNDQKNLACVNNQQINGVLFVKQNQVQLQNRKINIRINQCLSDAIKLGFTNPQKMKQKGFIYQFQIQINQQQQEDDNINQNNNILKSNQKQLLKSYTLMPSNTFVKMNLTRSKQQNGLKFVCKLQSNMRFIVNAKLIGKSFILSDIQNKFEQNGQGYQGKIKTSFFGNQVQYFSPGLSPKKAKQNQQIRKPICMIVTQTQSIIDQIKPRVFFVYYLKPQYDYYKDLKGVKKNEQIPLHKLYHDYIQNRDKIILYQNRKSKWNQKHKIYSLNMKGRAKIASVKNFILQSLQQNNRQIMLFGKTKQNQFSLDLHHPFSPNIALAIAISSFSYKSW